MICSTLQLIDIVMVDLGLTFGHQLVAQQSINRAVNKINHSIEAKTWVLKPMTQLRDLSPHIESSALWPSPTLLEYKLQLAHFILAKYCRLKKAYLRAFFIKSFFNAHRTHPINMLSCHHHHSFVIEKNAISNQKHGFAKKDNRKSCGIWPNQNPVYT